MAVSGTSSMSSALGVTGKGIGGLATGLNTDELVAALTSGTKAKIAKQGQQKQLLNWKMTAYRSMSTALTAFQTKFLKTSTSSKSNTNIMSSSFFNTYKATSSSDKVSVSTTSGAKAGNFTIDEVTQLATSESYTSTKKMSTALNLDIKSSDVKDGMFTGQTLKLKVEGFDDKTIKLDDLNKYVKDGEITNMADLKAGLQKLMNDAYRSSGVVTVNDNGNGGFTLDSNARITVNASNVLLGVDAGDSSRVSTGTKIGDLEAFKNIQGDVLSFNINGVEISVNKRDDIDTLLSKVTNSGADVRMDYDEHNDVFTLTSKKYGANSSFEIKDVHGNLMNEIFGAKGGSGMGSDYLITDDEITVGVDLATKLKNMTAAEKKSLGEKLSNMSFSLTINGETKSVRLDATLGIGSKKLADGDYTAEDVYKAINKGIESAFGYNKGVKFGADADGKTVISTSLGESFSFSASNDFAQLLGVSDGSKFTAGNAITDFGLASTINSSTIYDDLKNANGYLEADKLNITSENPGVFEMTINGVTKTVTVTPGKDAKGNEIPVTNDNFVERLNAAIKTAFGDDAANVSFSAEYDKLGGTIPVIKPSDFEERADGYYKDGNKYYDLPPEGEDGYWYKGQKVIDKDGYPIDENGDKVINVYKNIGVKLTLNVDKGLNGATETSVSMSGDLSAKMGFVNGAHNYAATANTIKLSDLNNGEYIGSGKIMLGSVATNEDGSVKTDVDGKPVIEYDESKFIEYDENTNMTDLIYDINTKFAGQLSAEIKDGKLSINSLSDSIYIRDEIDAYTPVDDDDTAERGLLKNVFGISGGQFETAAEDFTSTFATEDVLDENGNVIDQKAASSRTLAKNALLTIDGKEIEYSSNTVTYNGVNLTLNDISTEKIKIGVQSDPEDVVTRIKEWMDDYNALVYTINSAINEGKKIDYPPLTDDQKAEMTEDQIKTWETEAKKGILRNDQTLKGILTDMRKALYERVESAGISLYDIGIVTKSSLADPNQAGQLEFDSVVGNGEERLREMLTNNPDKVRMLFADSENGIGTKLNKIINQAANPSSVDRGALVRLAGTENLTGDNTSQLGNKIASIDKFITSLKLRLETEYNRYWKQFSSLETSVQKMNSQSSWLQSQ